MISIFKKTGLTLALIGATSLASAVEFDDFSAKVSHLKLNVDAAKVGENLRLTPNDWYRRGSAFTLKTLNVAKFSTFFTFQITGPFSNCDPDPGCGPGDGFTFAMQALSPNEIGANGPALGYGGEVVRDQLVGGIRNSIAVEVDTHYNFSFHDPNANHIAIDINGDTRHNDPSLVKKIAPSFTNGKTWYAWLDYDGETLQVRISQNDHRPKKAQLETDIDIPSLLGVNNDFDNNKAYVGFTGGTKGGYENHDILFWQYREKYQPIGLSSNHSND
jgi:hypothetical protein